MSDILEAASRLAAIAKRSPRGLPIEHLVPGALVTISANKATGCRSGISLIYEVMAAEGGNVLLRDTGLIPGEEFRPVSVLLVAYAEREFYSAEGMARALQGVAGGVATG